MAQETTKDFLAGLRGEAIVLRNLYELKDIPAFLERAADHMEAQAQRIAALEAALKPFAEVDTEKYRVGLYSLEYQEWFYSHSMHEAVKRAAEVLSETPKTAQIAYQQWRGVVDMPAYKAWFDEQPLVWMSPNSNVVTVIKEHQNTYEVSFENGVGASIPKHFVKRID